MQDACSQLPQIVVIGCVFLDHKLVCSDNGVIPEAEQAILSHGGIGRNVAENLAWLGLNVGLITLSSPESIWQAMEDRLNSAGVKLLARSVDGGIGNFRVTLDQKGDVLQSVATPPPLNMLDWAFVSQHLDWLMNADYILVEMGLDFTMLEHVLANSHKHGIPVYGLPTRLHVVGSRWKLMQQLNCLILNNHEASFILDVPVETPAHASQVIEKFRERGISRVIITLGDAGVVVLDEGAPLTIYPAVPATSLDTTGAGDAFAAGLLAGLANARCLDDSIRIGLALARHTVETYDSVKIGSTATSYIDF